VAKEALYPIDTYSKVIINAAITGMVPTKEETPYVPLTEEEIVRDAILCHKSGASIVHLHIRDEKGAPDYRAERYGKIIKRIRNECDIIICVSTSARVFKEFDQRAEVLFLKGDEKPEMASLTLGSFNFPKQASVNSPDIIVKLAETMIKNNIKPELEVFDAGMLNYAKYLDKKLALPRPLYFNLLLGSLGGIPGRPRDLSYLVQNLPDDSVWAAAGIGLFQLPVNATALIKGGGVRVGLEDNIYFDYEKKELATNERLIKRIVRIAKELRREIATPGETRQILGIKKG
jgi:3-keto-5-aminohexanoate cleavage enzyme